MLETELFSFLGNTTEAIFAVRPKGDICFWNGAAEKLFGYRAEQVMGKTCFEVLHGTDTLGTSVCSDRLSVMKPCGKPTEIPSFDLNVTASDGSQLWVNLATLVYHDSRSGSHVLVHVARNISAQKKQEELTARMAAVSREIGKVVDKAAGAAPVSNLSAMEIRILRMLAAGESSSLVVKRLRISSQTLRNHLHRINRKLRTHNRLEAVTHASLRKLI